MSHSSKFIKITTGNYLVFHGYDENNQEITEEVKTDAPMVKSVAVERIQSVSEKYVLVNGPHGRQFYWEYEEDFEGLKQTLEANGLLLS
ncbi:MAG: hypothetical protein MUD08_05245 [Cytophagales bacterium]|nr:hypothetical protein [Cytophagales bacterium]